VWKHGAFKPSRLRIFGMRHFYCLVSMTYQPHVEPSIIASRRPFPA
jgi:hypothetical protein